MKKYRLVILAEVESSLRHLHFHLKAKIRKALETIGTNPYLGKPLNEPLEGFFSYRVSQYRIIYQIKEREVLVEVIEIAERKIVYSKAAAIIRKMLN